MSDNQVYAICATVFAVAVVGFLCYLVKKDFEK